MADFHANLLAVEASAAAGRVINVACGVSTSVNKIIESIQSILGTDLQTEHVPPRPGDVLKSDADISLARELLGYEPTVGLEEGLRRTVEWFHAQ